MEKIFAEVATFAGTTPQRRLTPNTLDRPASRFPLDKADEPFRLPHIDRLLYYDSSAKVIRPWPKKEVWEEAMLKDEAFRPPNPATKMVKKLKEDIKDLKEKLGTDEEKPYDEEENYQDYSLEKVRVEPDKSLISERITEGGIRVKIPATKMREKWVLPEHEEMKEGPIRDGNVVRYHTGVEDVSKRPTRDINELSTLEREQLWKYIHYRQDGITFEEAEKQMKQEKMTRLGLMSYPTVDRKDCERCHPTPASSSGKPNPFVFTEAETAIRCAVRPGLTHLSPSEVNQEDGTPERLYSRYIITPTRADPMALEAEAEDKRRWKTSAEDVAKELEKRREEEEKKRTQRRPFPVLSTW